MQSVTATFPVIAVSSVTIPSYAPTNVLPRSAGLHSRDHSLTTIMPGTTTAELKVDKKTMEILLEQPSLSRKLNGPG